MASVAVSPPSVNGTTNDYGGVTGLTLVRTETTNQVTTQIGTNFRVQYSPQGNTPGPVVVFNVSQSGTNIGLNLPKSFVFNPGQALYQTMNQNLTDAGATNVSTSGSGTMTTDFTTSAVFTANPGTTISFTGTFLIQGFQPTSLGNNNANVQFLSAVNTTQNVTVPVYTFTNNTGDLVTVEGTTINNGATLAVAIVGSNFNITYTEPATEEPEEEEPEEETTTIVASVTVEPTGNNPNYSILLPQIASETDAAKKQLLINQTYQFNSPLSQAEEDLFAYINSGYTQDNPNATDGTPDAFISYVGIYFDEVGRNTA